MQQNVKKIIPALIMLLVNPGKLPMKIGMALEMAHLIRTLHLEHYLKQEKQNMDGDLLKNVTGNQWMKFLYLVNH